MLTQEMQRREAPRPILAPFFICFSLPRASPVSTGLARSAVCFT